MRGFRIAECRSISDLVQEGDGWVSGGPPPLKPVVAMSSDGVHFRTEYCLLTTNNNTNMEPG